MDLRANWQTRDRKDGLVRMVGECREELAEERRVDLLSCRLRLNTILLTTSVKN